MLTTLLARARRARERAGPRGVATLVGLALFSLCAWAFLELADDAPEGDYLELENRILLWFRVEGDPGRSIGPAWLPEVGRDVTALGSATVLIMVTAASAGWLLMRGRGHTAIFVAASTTGSYAINWILKAAFERGRPTVVPHLAEQFSLSFPSGHSMVGAATYLTLGALLAQTVASRREQAFFFAIAVLLSTSIGVSRVYLGVHYPTDVLAGWAAGAAWAILCWGATVWLQRSGALQQPPDEVTSKREGSP